MRQSKYTESVHYLVVPNGMVMVASATNIRAVSIHQVFIPCTPEERDAFFKEHCK